MSGLYPSLEDMKVDQMVQAQTVYDNQVLQQQAAISYPVGSHDAPASPNAPPAYTAKPGAAHPALYPSLEEYMGLAITPQMLHEHNTVVADNQQVVARQTPASQMQIAPISGNSTGIRRSEIQQGVRELYLCKDQEGKMGLRVRAVNKGVFVAFVHKNSPSALAGLRFGDQILQVDGENTAGWDTDKAMKKLSKCSLDRITLAVRDRPFERTITMQKDSNSQIGFVFKSGKISAIVKDSSAARNGVLTDHQLVEVNGQNVVGLKDKEIGGIIDSAADRTVTITVIPTFIYDHIIKSMGSSLIKKYMDHSVPDL